MFYPGRFGTSILDSVKITEITYLLILMFDVYMNIGAGLISLTVLLNRPEHVITLHYSLIVCGHGGKIVGKKYTCRYL